MRNLYGRLRALEAKIDAAAAAATERDFNPIVIFDPADPPPELRDVYPTSDAGPTQHSEGGRPWPE